MAEQSVMYLVGEIIRQRSEYEGVEGISITGEIGREQSDRRISE